MKEETNGEDVINVNEIPSPKIKVSTRDEPKWVKNLGLDFTDRFIVEKDQCLTTSHMSAVNKLLKKEFPAINGFQETNLDPKKDKNGLWKLMAKTFKPVEPLCAQKYYNGANHWIMSFTRSNEKDAVYVIRNML